MRIYIHFGLTDDTACLAELRFPQLAHYTMGTVDNATTVLEKRCQDAILSCTFWFHSIDLSTVRTTSAATVKTVWVTSW